MTARTSIYHDVSFVFLHFVMVNCQLDTVVNGIAAFFELIRQAAFNRIILGSSVCARHSVYRMKRFSNRTRVAPVGHRGPDIEMKQSRHGASVTCK